MKFLHVIVQFFIINNAYKKIYFIKKNIIMNIICNYKFVEYVHRPNEFNSFIDYKVKDDQNKKYLLIFILF